MRFFAIGESDAVLWQAADGSSGVLRRSDTEPLLPGTPAWGDYEAWCARGNELAEFAAVVALALEDARLQALVRLNHAADAVLQPILAQYPCTEVASWPEQVAEAIAWQADANASTPLLDAIASGGDKADLCAGVLAKADEYKRASGAVIAWRRAVSEWIEEQTEADALTNWQPQFPKIPV